MKRIRAIFKKFFNYRDSGIFRQIPLNVSGELYTSPMPFGAYDYGSRLLRIYRKNKIEHVFVLVNDTELAKKARRDLLKLYKKNDVSYSRYIINDFQATSIEVISALVQEAIERLQKQRVVIHCHAGVGRTAVAACCIAIAIEHFTIDKAIEHICRNMAVNITSEQKDLIKRFESQYNAP